METEGHYSGSNNYIPNDLGCVSLVYLRSGCGRKSIFYCFYWQLKQQNSIQGRNNINTLFTKRPGLCTWLKNQWQFFSWFSRYWLVHLEILFKSPPGMLHYYWVPDDLYLMHYRNIFEMTNSYSCFEGSFECLKGSCEGTYKFENVNPTCINNI